MQKLQYISQSISKVSRFIKMTISIILMINLSIISIIIENLLIVIITIVIALGVYKNISDINKKNAGKVHHVSHKIINSKATSTIKTEQLINKKQRVLTKEERAIQEYEEYPSW